MAHAGCVFVAGIHPSRTWMLWSFESMRWNACVHRLSSESFLGMESEPKLTPKKPSTRKILHKGGSNPRRFIKQDSKPNTLPTSYSGPHSLCLKIKQEIPTTTAVFTCSYVSVEKAQSVYSPFPMCYSVSLHHLHIWSRTGCTNILRRGHKMHLNWNERVPRLTEFWPTCILYPVSLVVIYFSVSVWRVTSSVPDALYWNYN